MLLTIDLPSREEQLAFNRQRWGQLLADRGLADLPNKIETNAHGLVVMNPPPSGSHSIRQGEIAYQLRSRLGGHALPECPLSTLDGVKAVDIGWYSAQRFRRVEDQTVFELAPEICVEVLSPSNTQGEMGHKKKLYFDAGAKEVWLCQTDGRMHYFCSQTPDRESPSSGICPGFPERVSR